MQAPVGRRAHPGFGKQLWDSWVLPPALGGGVGASGWSGVWGPGRGQRHAGSDPLWSLQEARRLGEKAARCRRQELFQLRSIRLQVKRREGRAAAPEAGAAGEETGRGHQAPAAGEAQIRRPRPGGAAEHGAGRVPADAEARGQRPARPLQEPAEEKPDRAQGTRQVQEEIPAEVRGEESLPRSHVVGLTPSRLLAAPGCTNDLIKDLGNSCRSGSSLPARAPSTPRVPPRPPCWAPAEGLWREAGVLALIWGGGNVGQRVPPGGWGPAARFRRGCDPGLDGGCPLAPRGWHWQGASAVIRRAWFSNIWLLFRTESLPPNCCGGRLAHSSHRGSCPSAPLCPSRELVPGEGVGAGSQDSWVLSPPLPLSGPFWPSPRAAGGTQESWLSGRPPTCHTPRLKAQRPLGVSPGLLLRSGGGETDADRSGFPAGSSLRRVAAPPSPGPCGAVGRGPARSCLAGVSR
ncbi:uncharacterized protein NOP53 [Chrysemys picta bellii]|uniref:uncharacterized protein NOP53 n=1 Tax=Chrysemys picta bellii TaxID=8478 RepID=UPI0032B2AE56